MTRAHFLKPAKAQAMPQYLCVVDTETVSIPIDENTVEARLDFGMAWFGRYGAKKAPRELTFTSNEPFWDYIDDALGANKKVWVFAHNMGGFDSMVLGLLSNMERLGYKLRRNVMECPPFFMLFTNKRGASICVVDSLNWMRMSLKAIGRAVGLEKLEDPGESNRGERITYCRRDVEILWKWLIDYIEFIEDEDLGNFSVTLASQSLTAYRHRFLSDHQILIRHQGEETLERAGYYGGRTEAFRFGKINGAVAHYDVNSLYPSVMRKRLFPARFYFADDHFSVSKYRDTVRLGRDVLARVTLRTSEPAYPYKTQGKLLFPTGEFVTVLCGAELEYAVEHGHVAKWHEAQVYEMEELFTSYIDFFYQKRLYYIGIDDDFRAQMCKLFMNSLYGKFGQRAPEWEETENAPFHEGPGYYFHSVIDGHKQQFRTISGFTEAKNPMDRGEAQYANCAIAAWVTSYARQILWQGMKTAGLSQVHYVDTDSLFMTTTGEQRLIEAGLVDPPTKKNLGLWHPEETGDGMEIWGPKDYRFLNERKTKGVRSTAIELREGVYQQPQFRSFKGALNRGHPEQMRILDMTKTLQRKYNKGIVGEDGSITPFNLPTNSDLIDA